MRLPVTDQRIPFSQHWQRVFFHELLDDPELAAQIGEHIEPHYADNEIAQWAWATARDHTKRYGVAPSWDALAEYARRLDPKSQEVYRLGLEQLRNAPTQDVEWVRSTALEWIRRNVFVRAMRDAADLYNGGKFDASYDALMREMDRFNDLNVTKQASVTWLMEELARRQVERNTKVLTASVTSTGINELDLMMGGGLDLGQLGIWMSYSKVGKTTMLINNGRVAARAHYRNVLHCYFEGTAEQISNRYDASFSGELYTAVKRGEMDSTRYNTLFAEYQYLRQKVAIYGFTDHWDYSVSDVWDLMVRLKRKSGWVPHVVLIDYGDLLRGRGRYDNDLDSNAAAYRDLKSLSTRGQGYAIWTAAQAQKPRDADFDTKPHLLKSSSLGGRYEKVKVADLLASMNATYEERTVKHQMRIFVEIARDFAGGAEIVVPCAFDRMVFGAGAPGYKPPDVGQQSPPGVGSGLGYKQLTPGMS